MHENFKEYCGIRLSGINHALTLCIPACSPNGSTGSVEKRILRASNAKRLQRPLIPGGHTGDGLSGIPPAGHLVLSLHSRWEFDSPIPDGVSSATLVHHSDRPCSFCGGDDTCQTLSPFALRNAKLAGASFVRRLRHDAIEVPIGFTGCNEDSAHSDAESNFGQSFTYNFL